MKLSALLVIIGASSIFAAEPPLPQFRHVTLDAKIQIGYGLAIADVDGDKRIDVLLADKKQFVWYRNPGGEKARDSAAWTKHLLAENLTEKDNVCLAAQDIDGDGKCEIAVGAEWNPADTEKSGAVFYLVAPADRTQPWTPIKFPSVEPTTHRMRWLKLGERKWGLVVVPLHGRGNKNGEGAPVKVLLYHPPAELLTAGENAPGGTRAVGSANHGIDSAISSKLTAEWKSEVVDESTHMTHNFDLNLPYPEPAISLGGKEGLTRLIRQSNQSWSRERGPDEASASSKGLGVGEVRWLFLKLDAPQKDSRALIAAIEPMHGYRLIVYPMSGSVPHVLTDKLVDGHALACGDLLKSGSDQIVVGWRGKPGLAGSTIGVAIWAALDATGEKWRETVIDQDGMACEDLQLADLDEDGRLDIVASGRATKNVKLYFNDTPVAP